MKKNVIISLLLACISVPALAQTSLQELLLSVEKNNPALISAEKNLISTSAFLKMGRNPNDPEIEYTHVFGNENSNELTLKQSFDFPTVYRQRNNVSKYGVEKAETEFMAVRQGIFSEVTSLYVNVVALNNELT
ncbi:MAG: TolC family protein, partial [Rikenellaceae bacterium]